MNRFTFGSCIIDRSVRNDELHHVKVAPLLYDLFVTPRILSPLSLSYKTLNRTIAE